MTQPKIEPGDFIKDKDCGVCCGIVQRVAYLPCGITRNGRPGNRKGYIIRLGNGKLDFILIKDAVLVAR